MSTGRGRLIRPMLLEIARIDVEGTRAAGGYDDVRGQPRVAVPAPGVPARGVPRAEATVYFSAVRVPAQVENGLRGLAFNLQQMVQTGNQPKFKINCVFHFEDLEAAGLIDVEGHPRMRTGDRLLKIRDNATHDAVVTIEDGYATKIDDTSFGLGAAMRNLLVVTYESRAKGMAAA